MRSNGLQSKPKAVEPKRQRLLRASLVAQFGEERVGIWESGQMAGTIVFDLLAFLRTG